jgi:putative transposase
MPSRRIFDDELHAHFVTFSCYQHRQLLATDQAKRIVLGVLSSQIIARDGRYVGFVIMPDHVHAVVWFPRIGQISVFMQQWKRISSHHIREFMHREMTAYSDKIGSDDPVWQPKYYDFNLFNEEKVREKLQYMHENPVRKGLAPSICDWAWSSARFYEQGKSVGIPIQWID